MTDEPDLVVRSVTVSVVIDHTGESSITYNTNGDPSDWDVLGMLEYASAALRNTAGFMYPSDGDEDGD
jgi:hypothetical protein